jgi:AraC-like DNA-binding protein
LVDQLTRAERSPFRAISAPGHTIHVVTSGRVEQRICGMDQAFGPKTAVWYHEDESGQGQILEAPWTFYTVNFIAPTLMPPPVQHRVRRASRKLIQRAELLLHTWRDARGSPMVRHLRAHALLLEILLELLPESTPPLRSDLPTRLWWNIEAIFRSDLSQPMSMAILQKMVRRNQQNIIRACRFAVGMSPMKRIKQVRLNYARGLVQCSKLSMSEIAYRVGYGRVQEFSRDYRRHFGVVPTEDRRRGPRYRELELPDDR